MMDITVNELMELFVDTLQKCGACLLEMSDEHIGYYIFEEFDSGAISFLHENSLLKLKEAGLITENTSQKSAELRSKFMALQNTNQWSVDSVKCSKEWREVLELSDEIKSLMAI
jgi:hypothetical protein